MVACANRGDARGPGPPAGSRDLGIADLVDGGGGTIGLCDCPGVRARRFYPELLGPDLDAVEHWKPTAVLCPVVEGEVEHVDLTDILYELRRRGILCVQLHRDAGDAAGLEREWGRLRDRLIAELDHGGRLLILCSLGRGRTGRIAAWLAMERGATADQAIEDVRRLRPHMLAPEHEIRSVRDYVPKHAQGSS